MPVERTPEAEQIPPRLLRFDPSDWPPTGDPDDEIGGAVEMAPELEAWHERGRCWRRWQSARWEWANAHPGRLRLSPQDFSPWPPNESPRDMASRTTTSQEAST